MNYSQKNTKTKKSKFAVLLAAYNGKDWIEEQINSILNQQDVDVSLFISVDLSSDGTQSWCDELAKHDSRVNVLPEGGVFGRAARNFFRLIRDVDISQFDYVAFSDQDDVWVEDKLIRAHQKMQEFEVDAYSGNVLAFWPDGKEELIRKEFPQRAWDYLFESAGPGCSYVFNIDLATSLRNNVIENWEHIQNVHIHDWYCYAYARANGYSWHIDECPKLRYRQHDNNEIGMNIGITAFYKRLQIVTKDFGLHQSKLIAKLVGLAGDNFYKSWCQLRRRDMVRLAFKATQCRRRRRDQVFFFIACLFLALKPT